MIDARALILKCF